MPSFEFLFDRTVTVRETVRRTIQAKNLEEAQAASRILSSEFNQSCPEDTAAESDICGSWSADTGSVSNGNQEPDEIASEIINKPDPLAAQR